MEKVVKGFKPSGGKHCVTNSLKQIIEYYDFPLTEEMIFGIASGLSFVYINLEKSPMISGRTKVFEFEKKFGERLNIEIKCKSSSSYENAFSKSIKLLDADTPILIYVDMPYLDYLNMDEDSHFGGHAVVLFGYNNEKKQFFISDRDNSDNHIRTPKGQIAEDYHLVDFKQLENARSSCHRPFPAKNKYLEINIDHHVEVSPSIIFSAIKETCDNMLNPPAKLLGLSGIKKFSKEVLKWSKLDSQKLKTTGVTNYFLINADGGTGGGIFRNMYGNFLIQASYIARSKEMSQLGKAYVDVSKIWDNIGELMWNLFQTGDYGLLQKISGLAEVIHTQEASILTELEKLASLNHS